MSSVDTLVLKQKTIAGQIAKFSENFQKVLPEHRTLAYLRGRVDGLERYWISYQNFHMDISLRVKETEKSTHEYFAANHFGVVG